MLFNSFEFLLFFVSFISIYFTAPRASRPVVLLIASYLFYAGWRPSYVLLLIFTTLVDYVGALVIDTTRRLMVRRIAVAVSLGINLGILATLKYLDFAISTAIGAFGFFGVQLPDYTVHFILPVGISFYTFQSIGYTLDVYYRRMPAERNLLYYAIYVAFFPQLVAGPIERASHMLAQYKSIPQTSPARVASGLWLIGYGLFKKICIADVISPFVSGVYGNPTSFNGTYTLIATVLFAIQIYCDFSGYSDIAIGVARIMGYDLMFNFRQPYFARTLTEFWRAWHISLTTWFRDFIYLPLGGSRVSDRLWIRNVLIVFAVSGIWHGAAWTFVIWGLIHGLALVAEGLWGRWRRRGLGVAESPSRSGREGASWGPAPITIPVTMAVVLVGWVFFRAKSLPDAAYILRSWGHLGPINYGTFKMLRFPAFEILLSAGQIVILLAVDWLLKFKPVVLDQLRRHRVVSLVAGLALLFDLLLFGVYGRIDFIYFQF